MKNIMIKITKATETITEVLIVGLGIKKYRENNYVEEVINLQKRNKVNKSRI